MSSSLWNSDPSVSGCVLVSECFQLCGSVYVCLSQCPGLFLSVWDSAECVCEKSMKQ